MSDTIAEYGDPRVKANPSHDTVLESAPLNRPGMAYGPVRLVHRSAGWTTAGSMARLQENEIWGAIFDARSGGTCGQWFKTRAEAEAKFALMTTPKEDADA